MANESSNSADSSLHVSMKHVWICETVLRILQPVKWKCGPGLVPVTGPVRSRMGFKVYKGYIALFMALECYISFHIISHCVCRCVCMCMSMCAAYMPCCLCMWHWCGEIIPTYLRTLRWDMPTRARLAWSAVNKTEWFYFVHVARPVIRIIQPWRVMMVCQRRPRGSSNSWLDTIFCFSLLVQCVSITMRLEAFWAGIWLLFICKSHLSTKQYNDMTCWYDHCSRCRSEHSRYQCLHLTAIQ